MKPALVLGLALAANAFSADQYDNELIIAPTDQFGNIKQYPGHIRFDEQADDELLNIYSGFIEHEARLNDPSYRKFLQERRNKPATAADDEELFVAPQGKRAELFKKDPREGPIRMNGFMEQERKLNDPSYIKFLKERRYIATADDEELFVAPQGKLADLVKKYPRVKEDPFRMSGFMEAERRLNDPSYQKFLKETRNIATADDEELFVAPQGKLADLAKQYPGMIMFDEQADDELLVRPVVPHIAYDDDDELYAFDKAIVPQVPQDGIRRFYTPYFNKETGKWEIAPGQYTKFADDELGLRMVHRPVAAEHPYAFDDDELRIRPISVLPESVAADDELSFMPIPPKVFVNKEWFKTTKTTPEALIRDDEGDDELAYLGHLLNERAQPRSFDEYKKRAEKPSHVKAEERAQLKSELPKKPRRWRPHPDVIPMAEN